MNFDIHLSLKSIAQCNQFQKLFGSMVVECSKEQGTV